MLEKVYVIFCVSMAVLLFIGVVIPSIVTLLDKISWFERFTRNKEK